DERVLIEHTDVDKGRAQRPPVRGLCRQSPRQFLLGEEAARDQDVAQLAPIGCEYFLARKGVRGLVPTDLLACPQMLQVDLRHAGYREVDYDVRYDVAGHD